MKAYKKSRQARWKKNNPWIRFLEFARRRCNDTDVEGKNYANYGAKGIVCILTGEQVKFMWDRDGASKMKRPSIDRIDSSKAYCFGNCRFLEFDLNVRLPHMGASVADGGEEFT